MSIWNHFCRLILNHRFSRSGRGTFISDFRVGFDRKILLCLTPGGTVVRARLREPGLIQLCLEVGLRVLALSRQLIPN